MFKQNAAYFTSACDVYRLTLKNFSYKNNLGSNIKKQSPFTFEKQTATAFLQTDECESTVANSLINAAIAAGFKEPIVHILYH